MVVDEHSVIGTSGPQSIKGSVAIHEGYGASLAEEVHWVGRARKEKKSK